MRIDNLKLSGAALVHSEPFCDQRGVFSRLFCSRELSEILAGRSIVNINCSMTMNEGTIRGLHFQQHPHAEMKFVRCTRGKIFDIIVDMRKESKTFRQWHQEVLSAGDMKMLIIPEGFAHGFQTLTDTTEILYLTTAFYNSSAEGGLRYNDPALGIEWPLPLSHISDKDASHPLLK